MARAWTNWKAVTLVTYAEFWIASLTNNIIHGTVLIQNQSKKLSTFRVLYCEKPKSKPVYFIACLLIVERTRLETVFLSTNQKQRWSHLVINEPFLTFLKKYDCYLWSGHPTYLLPLLIRQERVWSPVPVRSISYFEATIATSLAGA